MNAPPRHESYVLEDGEKPVELIEDTKIPNAATIKIVKQDHTLGNMLRAQLLSMPQILFAGYKVPHPLHPYFLIKIQTDGSVTPQAILEQACKKLIGTMSSLETKFRREFSYKDVEGTSSSSAAAAASMSMGGGMGGGGGGGGMGGMGGHGQEDPYAPAGGMGGGGGGGGGWGRGRDYLDF